MLPNFAERFADEIHQPFHFEHGLDAALLVHGYPGTPAEMRPVAEILQALGWTVRGMLLPGFGSEIASLGEKRHHDWQDAVEAEIRYLRQNYRRVILVGYSMGGALAMNAAKTQKLNGLILFSPFVKIEHLLWKVLPAIRLVFPKVKIFRIIKPNFNDPQTRAGILNFMPNANLDEAAVQAAILDFELPIAMFDEIRILGQKAVQAAATIHVPSLVFQGLKDELVQAQSTRKLIRRLAQIDYHEIDAPHEIINPNLAGWHTIKKQISDYVLRLG